MLYSKEVWVSVTDPNTMNEDHEVAKTLIIKKYGNHITGYITAFNYTFENEGDCDTCRVFIYDENGGFYTICKADLEAEVSSMIGSPVKITDIFQDTITFSREGNNESV